MATRRDQLHSYQFLTQRVISAFVMRETDPAQSPLRRGIGAVFAGIMVAVVVAAGFGVYGILTKVGGRDWRTDGSVVVERETGASYVFLTGRLFPAVNYASALLASGQPAPQVFRVSRKSLTDVPRGLTIGIPGAPASLPEARQSIGLPWTLCSAAGADTAGRAVTTVSLVVGSAPAGARGLGDDQALLVTNDATGTEYMIWHGHRYVLRESRIVIAALFGAVATPVRVGAAWLNALPSGVSIGPIAIADAGKPSTAVPGQTIGALLEAVTGSGPQYYVVFDDGLAPITPLQKAILSAQSPIQPIPVSVSDATSARASRRLATGNDEFAAPQSPPALAQPGSPNDLMCSATTNGRVAPAVSTGGTLPPMAAGIPTPERTGDGAVLADRVTVPSGRVAVIRVLPSPDAATGPYYLVTDAGVRYPVPSEQVLQMLGYQPASAVEVPSSLVLRIPVGPALDPQAALRPVPIGPEPEPSPARPRRSAAPSPSASG